MRLSTSNGVTVAYKVDLPIIIGLGWPSRRWQGVHPGGTRGPHGGGDNEEHYKGDRARRSTVLELQRQLHSALGYRPPEEFEHAVGPVHPSAAATMQFFEASAGAESEGVQRVKRNVRPTRVC